MVSRDPGAVQPGDDPNLLDVLLALDQVGVEPVKIKGRVFYTNIARMMRTPGLWGRVQKVEPLLRRHLREEERRP